MLLTKKTKFSVSESQIKEDVLSKDGILLLKINVKYPDIVCAKDDCLARYAKKFYADVSKAFVDFAKTELAKRALNSYNTDKDGFLPYSALMKYDVTLLSKDYLSVMFDLSVSDGKEILSVEKKTQVWERKNGTKCRCIDFLNKQEIDDVAKQSGIKQIDSDLFVLREDGLEFFVKKENKYFSFQFSDKVCKLKQTERNEVIFDKKRA
ncbi:MAG: hypothetical protein J6Q89_05825 [Clostridia bacterium]|nr:hypothetical protein [Clostridia bacterium]